MEYKTTPAEPAPRLKEEDNYTIQVWEEKGGKYLGTPLKTTLNGITRAAWQDALQKFPGLYLVETNGPYLMREATAPAENHDEFGRIRSNGVCLQDLPQWYGLVARCACGNMNYVDRYDHRIQRWKGYPLERIAEKLSCSECTRARRPRGRIELDLYKLPR